MKERFEKLVAARGGSVKLLEGYGLTEAVTAIMAMPLGEYREGIDRRAVSGHAGEDLQAGHDRGSCRRARRARSASPARRSCSATSTIRRRPAQALRAHADGRTWLHTGDLGRMDADGFFYFTVRLKRMIKSSGFNVYPAQVEAVLYQHPLVAEACVVGVPDPAQVERVKAFVVLKDPAQASAATEQRADRALPRAA